MINSSLPPFISPASVWRFTFGVADARYGPKLRAEEVICSEMNAVVTIRALVVHHVPVPGQSAGVISHGRSKLELNFADSRCVDSSRPCAASAALDAMCPAKWLVFIRPSQGGFDRLLDEADLVMGKWSCSMLAYTI